MKSLKNKIIKLPQAPGVYQFINKSGEVLYVGKAKNLKSRIKSYFLSDIGRGLSIDIMIREARDIKIIETGSEIEAIILEADLINKLKPKYNIRQKDDKSFLVIKISREMGTVPIQHRDSSHVSLVRFKDIDFSDKSAEYFGPYPSGDALKRSLRYLRKIMPFRDCSTAKFRSYQKKQRQCLYGDLGVCPGVCISHLGGVGAPFTSEVIEKEHQRNIKMLKQFLRGKKQIVYQSLQKEMKKLSQEKRYEEAKIYRDRLYALDHIGEVAIGLSDDVIKPENILFKRIECYDVSNISGQFAVGSMVVFLDGKPEKGEYRRFKIKNITTPGLSLKRRGTRVTPLLLEEGLGVVGEPEVIGDLQMMTEMLHRRFKNDWPHPNLIIIDGGVAHLNLAQKIIKEQKQDIPVLSIAKGPKRQKNEFHFSNQLIAQYFHNNIDLERVAIRARDEAHRFAIVYYRKLHKKGLFNAN